MSGVQVKFSVSYNHVDEEGGPPYVATPEVYGTTNTSGGFTLSIQVEYATFLGLVSMSASVTDSRYVTISASGNYSTSGTTIYPSFTVMHDEDGNGISDEWEVALAEKFCPTLKLHHPTEWVAPEPVEYLGVNKQNLWFLLYDQQGGYAGDYPISFANQFLPSISEYYSWISNSNPNYSFLTGNGYYYCGRPPGESGQAAGRYWLRFHYNFAGQINSPSGWISYYQNERNQNQYPHTTYAHLFLYSGKPVIQYWFFYPYNDGFNNHEGDWEHINIRLTVQNPSAAAIEKIDFYFHHKVKTLSSGFQIEDGTHPIVYVGGSCAGIELPGNCEPGNATGGSYPWKGTWYNVGPFGYDEYVLGAGPTIKYNMIRIVILKDRDKINYDVHPEFCWLNVSIRFGMIEVSSPWDFVEPFANAWPFRYWFETDIGNNAVPSPAYNGSWNRVGACEGFENY